MEAFDKKTFHLGICMAGAVSAGAYTAGVMDYLLESLEHWEKARSLQEKGVSFAAGDFTRVPEHRVSIDVLGGASAGGMTATIMAAAAQIDFKPVNPATSPSLEETRSNPLFDAWVNMTEKAGSNMMDQMLDTSDITASADEKLQVKAALNSSFIKRIADSILDKAIEATYQRPYVAKDIDVFTTVTNLRGFDYKVTFKTTSGDRIHRMRMHRDYAFFKFGDIEEPAGQDPVLPNQPARTPTSVLANDGRIPINFKKGEMLNIEILKQAAMSTGAFPIGLESRVLSRGREYILRNKYLNLVLSTEKTGNVFYDFIPDGDPFVTLNVDGGVINNEPFEITQSLLDDRRQKVLVEAGSKETYVAKRTASEFDSTVIMIDPFPSEEATRKDYSVKQGLQDVIPALLSAMRGQLMMKDEQIRRAYLSEDYTRFLVMPIRSSDGLKDDTAYPIACGSLGGFGGFLSRDFRVHDFYLGRRNCQRFLQKHFSVPANAANPILEFGYPGAKQYGIEVRSDDGTINTYLPIIPDLRLESTEDGQYRLQRPLQEGKPVYPKIKISEIVELRGKIMNRVASILRHTVTVGTDRENGLSYDDLQASGIDNALGKTSPLRASIHRLGLRLYLAVGRYFGKKKITEMALKAILTDLQKRDLFE